MTTPRFATSRPAALTGRVGQAGDNRVHDVTLVQALLGQKRDRKSNRPYLRNHVTGKYDKFTAEALMRFRMDQRDGNMRQPLARSGPTLNKLAQGQSTVVLEGTNIAYKLATLAEPGAIEGRIAELLSAERKVELKAVMKDFISEWGIALDVEIKVAANNVPARSQAKWLHESLPLVAHFTPRNLWVDSGAGLSHVPNNAQFRTKAKALYEAVAADLKARCVAAFGITDPVDVKIQNGLKDDLACVVRTDLEGVEALAQFILAEGRKRGFTLAVRFFKHYLEASGSSIEIGREEALEFDLIRNAVQVNTERFKQRNFVTPEQGTPGFLALEEIAKNPKARFTDFEDHWKKDFSFSMADLAKILNSGATELGSFALGPGASSVTSNGEFLLRRQGDQVLVTGTITHVWTDPGYNFDQGKYFDEEARVLEKQGAARPFQWKAEWRDAVVGLMQIEKAFSHDATSRWISFEISPAS